MTDLLFHFRKGNKDAAWQQLARHFVQQFRLHKTGRNYAPDSERLGHAPFEMWPGIGLRRNPQSY